MTHIVGSEIVGHGWATVELDRAADELAGLLAPGSIFADATRSSVLGARCCVGRARPDRDDGAVWIVILEPDTEGRLAGYLARSGEGWAAVWKTDGDEADGREVAGPLGLERLTDGTPNAGPFRLLLTAATIER